MDKTPCNSPQDVEVRKGPWTMEEDLILINYIANHGEGVWNSLAKAAGNNSSLALSKTLILNQGWPKILHRPRQNIITLYFEFI